MRFVTRVAAMTWGAVCESSCTIDAAGKVARSRRWRGGTGVRARGSPPKTQVGAARRRAPRVPRRRARPAPRRRPRPDDGPRHGDTHGEYRLFGPRPAPFGPRLHGLVPATERLRHGRRRVRSVRRWSRGEGGRRDVLRSGRRSVGRRRRGKCHCSRGPEHAVVATPGHPIHTGRVDHVQHANRTHHSGHAEGTLKALVDFMMLVASDVFLSNCPDGGSTFAWNVRTLRLGERAFYGRDALVCEGRLMLGA